MIDRPSITELIEAVIQHLETHVIPATKATHHKLYFQTLVATNVLKIVTRELILSPAHLRAEWLSLNTILPTEPLPHSDAELLHQLATRNATLCDDIRAGNFDDSHTVLEHLKLCAIHQLEVANPKFLAALQAEDAS